MGPVGRDPWAGTRGLGPLDWNPWAGTHGLGPVGKEWDFQQEEEWEG